MSSIILFNKPYGVLSQFRADDANEHQTLSAFFTDKSLRVAGRLDATSEGLLLLTADGQINKVITQPKQNKLGMKTNALGKTYLVQVEGQATDDQLQHLSKGVMLKDGLTLPAIAKRLSKDSLPMPLWDRYPPIRQRQNVPTSWLMLTIYEGKNRQIRRMTAQVGLPCLRLIRWSVAGFELGELVVGQFVRVHMNAKRLAQLGLLPVMAQ